MYELRNASQRRRELEIELANEMRREQEQQQQQQRDARIPWQNAIAALQRQRAEIVREIELESQRGPFTGGNVDSDGSVSSEAGTKNKQQLIHVLYRDSATQMSPLPPTPPVRNAGRQQHATIAAGVTTDTENHYSIEGVVTLEPLQQTSAQPTHRTTTAATSHSQHQPQQHTVTTSTSTSTAGNHHHQPPKQQISKQYDMFSRPESHHDALNEVFSIQLKFAETMLKLEKSVQIRDQLLQRNAGYRSHRGVTRLPSRRANSTATRNHDHHRRRHASQSDSESYYEDDLESSDYDSFSSGASLGDYAMRLRRFTSDSELHATTSTNREAPSSTTTAVAPSAANSVADVPQSTNFNLSAVEEERNEFEATGAGDASSSASPDSQEARTPSTENSDKTSNNSSSTKQVRFGDGDGEYSTPVIARKFNFDNQSDDENDDRESILSFMDGSSVTSTELNDVSLIKAFEAFRRELGNLKAATPQWQKKKALSSSSSGITAAISAARALFASDESDAEDGKRAMLKPAVVMKKMLQNDDGVAKPAQQDPIVVANAALKQQQYQEKVPFAEPDRAALNERRRQLCLDIQAESAQLVLTFGLRNAYETERVKQHLIELRSELRIVDEQLQRL